jgi:hypothetical protein
VRRIHILLGAQSLILVLASVNRLWDGTDAEILPDASLRVVDAVNLLVLAPASVLAFFLLLEHVLTGAPERPRLALRFGFVAAAYLFAASYGMHEPADYLHARFCDGGDEGPFCAAIAYQDDGISHGLYFAGLVGISAVLLLAQAASRSVGTALDRRDRRLVLANASLVALAIAANLGFEEIGLDLVVVAAVFALAAVLLRRSGPRALTLYFAWGYGAGLVLTVAAKLAGG